MMPTQTGTYVSCPQWVSAAVITGLSSPGTLTNAWATRIVDGTGKLFCGTTTKLWGLTAAGAATDLSKGGSTYSSSTGWHFCQYGNITIAVTKGDTTQSRDSSGSSAFADLAGTPPKASICCVQTNAVLLFDYNDGTDTPDGWWASDIGDHTTWTPASSNQAANGRILHTPGKITAAIPFGQDVIVFKNYGVYRMQYVGGTVKWIVQLLRSDLGAFGRHDVLHCGDRITFRGYGGVWSYDGATWENLGLGMARSTPVSGSSSLSCCYIPQCRTALFQGIGSYNIDAQAWGNVPSVLAVGTGNPSTFYMIEGGFSSVQAVFSSGDISGPAAGGTPLYGVSFADADIYKGQEWANSSVTQYTSITTGAFGIGGDIDTKFDRILPRYRNTLGRTSNAGATELFGIVTLYTNPELGSGSAQTAVASSSNQKRFDQQTTAKYATVTITNASGLVFYSKSFEVEDVDWKFSKAGTT